MSKRPVPVWEPMTETDRLCIAALAACSFTPASFDKRFARDMEQRRGNAQPISQRQRAKVMALVYKYRRQIDLAIVAKAALQLADAQASFELRDAAPAPAQGSKVNPLDQLFDPART